MLTELQLYLLVLLYEVVYTYITKVGQVCATFLLEKSFQLWYKVYPDLGLRIRIQFSNPRNSNYAPTWSGCPHVQNFLGEGGYKKLYAFQFGHSKEMVIVLHPFMFLQLSIDMHFEPIGSSWKNCYFLWEHCASELSEISLNVLSILQLY